MFVISFHSFAAKNKFRAFAFSYGWLNSGLEAESAGAIKSSNAALIEWARKSPEVYSITPA